MSWYATGWAKRTRGHRSAGQKLVLLILGDYYDDEKGFAWPSQKTLAADCQIPERTVRYHLTNLEQQGFLTCLQKGNQHQPSRYELHTTVFAPTCEPAISEPATIAATGEPAIEGKVNRQPDAGEPAMPRITSKQEGTVKGTRKRVLVVSSEFRAEMKERFGSVLQDLDERIDESLSHSAARKYDDLERYVRGWLRRDAEKPSSKVSSNNRQPSRRVEAHTDAESIKKSWGQ